MVPERFRLSVTALVSALCLSVIILGSLPSCALSLQATGSLSTPASSSTSPVTGTQWYVSGDGDDAMGDGKSVTKPFRTLGKVAGRVNPGDRVWVMDGVYSCVTLTRSGTASAPIIWQAYADHSPEISFSGWFGIKVMASYIIIDGITITGNNDQVILSDAETDALKKDPDPLYNGVGISVDGRAVTEKHHHITIRRCTIRKCGGSGIDTLQSDYLVIEDNQVNENAWYSRYAESGINLGFLWNSDTAPGYHNYVQRNRVWNNRSLVKWYLTDDYSDGNGIIIDDSKNTWTDDVPAYKGRTLASNNVCFNNGGSGIHSYLSEHVDIIYNATYHNGQIVDYAEIFATYSNGVRFMNNIMFARDGGKVNDQYKNTNVIYSYNHYFNGTVVVKGSHDIIGDSRLLVSITDRGAYEYNKFVQITMERN